MKSKKVAQFFLTVLVCAFALFSCRNGVMFDKPNFSAPPSPGTTDREIENPSGGQLPDYGDKIEDGTAVFSFEVKDFAAAENCEVSPFNAAFIGSVYVAASAPAEKIEIAFNLLFEGLTDDRIIPAAGEKPETTAPGALTLEAKYTKQNGSPEFAKVFIDGLDSGKSAVISKEKNGVSIPVKIQLDNTLGAQKGFITIAFKYSSRVYDVNENFREIKLYVLSADSSSGGSDKPVYTLSKILPSFSDLKFEFSDVVDSEDYRAVLNDDEFSYNAPYTAELEATFINLAEDKKIKVSAVSVTEGIAVEQISSSSGGLVKFKLTYKEPAAAFDYKTDIAVIRFEPEPSATDYYGGSPVEKTIRVIRKPAVVFYTPTFTASTLEGGVKQDVGGYYTELMIPAQDPESEAVLSYTIYRKDDRSANFVNIGSVSGAANTTTIYKDYNALIYRSPKQDYKIEISLDTAQSKSSETVKGSRQITNREFLISAMENIRYVMIDKNGHTNVGGTIFSENKTTNGEFGGSFTHDRIYTAWIDWRHKYIFSNYKPNSMTQSNGNLEYYFYNGVTGNQHNIITYKGSGSYSAEPFRGTISVTTPLGNGAVVFNNVHINSNTWSNPSWSSGSISVTYNGTTVSYSNLNWRFVIYNTDTEFRNYINAASYTQR